MEPEDKAADLAADMRSTGLNHIAFDVGPAIEAEEGIDGLKGFLSELNRQVKSLRDLSAIVHTRRGRSVARPSDRVRVLQTQASNFNTKCCGIQRCHILPRVLLSLHTSWPLA